MRRWRARATLRIVAGTGVGIAAVGAGIYAGYGGMMLEEAGGILFEHHTGLPLVINPIDIAQRGTKQGAKSFIGYTNSDPTHGLVIGKYANISRRADLPGQAHHLNQSAAYRDIIPYQQGVSIKLEGNILTDVGAPHTRAHQSLENFWNLYRGSDIMPANLEYTRALQQSLRATGLPELQVQQALGAAIRERVEAGLLGGMPVPRIPNPIYNLAQ